MSSNGFKKQTLGVMFVPLGSLGTKKGFLLIEMSGDFVFHYEREGENVIGGVTPSRSGITITLKDAPPLATRDGLDVVWTLVLN